MFGLYFFLPLRVDKWVLGCSSNQMAATTSQWWRRLVNAYEAKAGMMVYLQLCDPYLSSSGVRFSRWGAIPVFVPLSFTFKEWSLITPWATLWRTFAMETGTIHADTNISVHINYTDAESLSLIYLHSVNSDCMVIKTFNWYFWTRSD